MWLIAIKIWNQLTTLVLTISLVALPLGAGWAHFFFFFKDLDFAVMHFTNRPSKPCLLLEVDHQNYNPLNLESQLCCCPALVEDLEISGGQPLLSPRLRKFVWPTVTGSRRSIFFPVLQPLFPLPVFIKLVKFLLQLCQPCIMLGCAHHNALQLPGNQVWRWHAEEAANTFRRRGNEHPAVAGEAYGKSRGWNWGAGWANFANFSSVLCLVGSQWEANGSLSELAWSNSGQGRNLT